MTSGEIQTNAKFKLVAGDPVLDFVNTLDWRFRRTGPEELLNSYRDLLRFATQSEMLDKEQSERLIQRASPRASASVLRSCAELREALADALYSGLDGQRPTATAIKALERYFHAAQSHQRLSWEGSGLRWGWPAAGREPELPLWLLSFHASRLLTSEAVHMVRACDNPECRWLFMDTSKNHTRRWCDMKLCGNRMKARRFKAQRAT